MNRHTRWGTVLATVQHRQVSQVIAVGAALVMSLIGIYVQAIIYGLIAVLVVLMVMGIRTYVSLNRTKQELAREDGPEPLSAAAVQRVQTVITPFDSIPKGRPAPVVSLIDHLPQLRDIRLVVSPDVPGATTGVQRRDELTAWLTANRPHLSVDVQLLDARVSPFNFDEAEVGRLAHSFEACKALPGVVVDVTGGTKVMSIACMKAAESAALPVTYLIQPPAEGRHDGFYGLTLLTDPDAALGGDERGPS